MSQPFTGAHSLQQLQTAAEGGASAEALLAALRKVQLINMIYKDRMSSYLHHYIFTSLHTHFHSYLYISLWEEAEGGLKA